MVCVVVVVCVLSSRYRGVVVKFLKIIFQNSIRLDLFFFFFRPVCFFKINYKKLYPLFTVAKNYKPPKKSCGK